MYTPCIHRFLAGLLTAAMVVAQATPAAAHGNGELPPDMFFMRGVFTPPSAGSFVNYETPHVHPLDLNPAATFLAACNTADGMVELFAVDGAGALSRIDSIRVGFDPVSARFRTDNELWVVNHLSDSISIVDVAKRLVVATIQTYDGYAGTRAGDEPTDVVFVTGGLALVTGSRSDIIQKYNATTRAYVSEFRLAGEDPRMLAVNAAGTSAYAAIFESGNSSTILDTSTVNNVGPYDPDGPGGQLPRNPPFNNGVPGTAWVADGVSVVPNDFTVSGAGQPPRVALIVKKNAAGSWRDDNNANWTQFVTGVNAAASGRPTGWDLLDNDVAILTSAGSFNSATYATRLMNHVMALGVNPADGEVFAVGTDATNQIRFEPNITGTFTRVMLGITNATGTLQHLVDLNEAHLAAVQGGTAYSTHSVSQSERNKSIGDPRGIAFKPGSAVAYISGMGSNNVVGVNTGTGARIALGHNLSMGAKQGPTGIVHHPTVNRLYVLNKFGGNVKTINTTTPGSETIVDTDAFFDPTPGFINDGRVHLYDTHQTSGLGQIACASCHVDSRMDRLAWDLGNPAGGSPLGVEKFIDDDVLTGSVGENPPGVHNFVSTLGGSSQDGNPFHTMKGPMTTQTLQDIIRHEPLHWRGDRDGIEEFAGAFSGLQGADAPLNSIAMDEFKFFLSTIHFPPNPFRPLDNSLPGGPGMFGGGNSPTLPLPGHVSPGGKSFSPPGTPLPNGSAWQGFDDYVDLFLDGPGAIRCVTCHALPMGSGPITTAGGQTILPGPNGEAHVGMVSNDGTGQPHIKVPQLRNQLDKEGFFTNQFLAPPFVSRAGFGTIHSGRGAGGIAAFLGAPIFGTQTDQDLADIVAFTLCINGDDFDDLFDLPGGPAGGSPNGGPAQTAHAAVGRQVTITSGTPPAAEQNVITALSLLANADKIGLIATGRPGSVRTNWVHVSGTGSAAMFQPDTTGAPITIGTLQGLATVADPITFMAVPTESELRMGIDRDEDGERNGSEIALNTDNENPLDNIFVDKDFIGESNGSASAPFTTVSAGVVTVLGSAGKNAFVHIKAGDYSDTGTLSNGTRFVLRAEGGTVRIGL